MKKLLILLFALCVWSASYSQSKNWVYNTLDASLGLSVTGKLRSENKTFVPLTIGVSVFNLYFEFASNLAHGKGEYLDYSSSQSYATDKVNVTIMSLGWNIPAIQDKLIITPKLGYLSSYAICQDPIGWNTYFHAGRENRLVVGVLAKYFFSENIGVAVGGGLNQIFTIQLVAKL